MNPENLRFSRVLLDLVVENGYTRKNGSPDWVQFVSAVPNVSYETLRKALAKERDVSEQLMRRVAHTLSVEPTVFTEYRLIQARRELDPRQVGWPRAIQALAALETSGSQDGSA
jgi:hypothetical protein